MDGKRYAFATRPDLMVGFPITRPVDPFDELFVRETNDYINQKKSHFLDFFNSICDLDQSPFCQIAPLMMFSITALI